MDCAGSICSRSNSTDPAFKVTLLAMVNGSTPTPTNCLIRKMVNREKVYTTEQVQCIEFRHGGFDSTTPFDANTLSNHFGQGAAQRAKHRPTKLSTEQVYNGAVRWFTRKLELVGRTGSSGGITLAIQHTVSTPHDCTTSPPVTIDPSCWDAVR